MKEKQIAAVLSKIRALKFDGVPSKSYPGMDAADGWDVGYNAAIDIACETLESALREAANVEG